MTWDYMHRCSDGTLYVGRTKNLENRLHQHASGHGASHTAERLPIQLVWFQEFSNVGDAWRRERKLHGWGAQKREALIRGWEEIKRLAKPPSQR